MLILAESGPWKNASLLDCQRWIVNPVPRFLSFGVARGSVRSHSLAALSACKTFQDVSLITKRSGSGDRDTERIRTSLRCQENAADCMLPCEGCLRETRPAGIDRSGHSNRGGGAGEWVIRAAPCEQERIDLPIRIRSHCWRERPVATWLLDLDSNQGLAA